MLCCMPNIRFEHYVCRKGFSRRIPCTCGGGMQIFVKMLSGRADTLHLGGGMEIFVKMAPPASAARDRATGRRRRSSEAAQHGHRVIRLI